jgi:hypothetical protein
MMTTNGQNLTELEFLGGSVLYALLVGRAFVAIGAVVILVAALLGNEAKEAF